MHLNSAVAIRRKVTFAGYGQSFVGLAVGMSLGFGFFNSGRHGGVLYQRRVTRTQQVYFDRKPVPPTPAYLRQKQVFARFVGRNHVYDARDLTGGRLPGFVR